MSCKAAQILISPQTNPHINRQFKNNSLTKYVIWPCAFWYWLRWMLTFRLSPIFA